MAKTPGTELIEQVRRVLWQHWDPIGVNHSQDATSEYDSYAPEIARMLVSDCTQNELDSRLAQLEVTDMGLPAKPASTRAHAVINLLSLVSSAPRRN